MVELMHGWFSSEIYTIYKYRTIYVCYIYLPFCYFPLACFYRVTWDFVQFREKSNKEKDFWLRLYGR